MYGVHIFVLDTDVDVDVTEMKWRCMLLSRLVQLFSGPKWK